MNKNDNWRKYLDEDFEEKKFEKIPKKNKKLTEDELNNKKRNKTREKKQ